MKKTLILSLAAAPVAAFAALYGDTPDAQHAWAVHDWNRPKPTKVSPGATCGQPPSDAIVLFDGTEESFKANWCGDGGKPTKWTYDPELKAFGIRFREEKGKKKTGVGSIFTCAEFGDCQLHLEYRHDPAQLLTDKGPQMRGNSGIFLMGSYELQVLESYNTSKEAAGTPSYIDNYADGQAGSVYAENPPLVNPARKPGEWQVYDIVFHQPVWEGDKLVHPGSVTLFFNGVLVQDHWEMEGLTTHCKRRPLAPHATKAPLHFQDHGCEVSYRNIWYRPLASRWANTTHSTMAAKKDDVMALRRQTAATLFAKIADPKAVTATNVKALAEVISYSYEDKFAAAFDSALEALRAKNPSDAIKKDVNKTLDVLVRNKVLTEDRKLK